MIAGRSWAWQARAIRCTLREVPHPLSSSSRVSEGDTDQAVPAVAVALN